MEIKLYTDGGARGNPGPGAAGVFLCYKENTYTYGFYLGIVTNNQAEYLALKLGLELIKRKFSQNPGEKIKVYLDSELIVKQLKGEYRVKDPTLKSYYQAVKSLIKDLPMIEFNHVSREKNAYADAAVNQVLDLQNGINKINKTSSA